MTYGAVDVDMWWPTSNLTSYWNEATDSVYTYGSHTANHDVLVVGWDDAYAATNFATTPPGAGAFLVKNSWGASLGRRPATSGSPTTTRPSRYDGYNMAFAVRRATDTNVRAVPVRPARLLARGRTVRERGPRAGSPTCSRRRPARTSPRSASTPRWPAAPRSGSTRASARRAQRSRFGHLREARLPHRTVRHGAAINAGQPFFVAVQLTIPDAGGTALPHDRPVERPLQGTAAPRRPRPELLQRRRRGLEDVTTTSASAQADVCLKAYTGGNGRAPHH